MEPRHGNPKMRVFESFSCSYVTLMGPPIIATCIGDTGMGGWIYPVGLDKSLYGQGHRGHLHAGVGRGILLVRYE